MVTRRKPRFRAWVKRLSLRVLIKLIADTVGSAFKLALAGTLILVPVLCALAEPHLRAIHRETVLWVLVWISWTALLAATLRLVAWSRARTEWYPNEEAALGRLQRDIGSASQSVTILGHACANIFVLEEAYRSALRNGADITVLSMDPDSKELMENEVSLEGENLADLVEILEEKKEMPDGLLEGLTELPSTMRATRMPILFSLVYGWFKLYAKADVGEFPGKVDLAVYCDDDCRFKATVIDGKVCYFGNYSMPVPLWTNNRLEVLRQGADVTQISEYLRDIREQSATREVSYQLAQGWNNELKRLARGHPQSIDSE